MQGITLLLADDHNVVRQGLRALLSLQPHFEILGEAATGREAVALTEKLLPDVVVMDLAMPVLNGVEATRQITRASPSSRIIVLSAYGDDKYLDAVISAGAAAYLLKSAAAKDLTEAIHEVHKGKPYFSPEIARRLRKRRRTNASAAEQFQESPAGKLSVREAEILQLTAEGFSNKEIAAQLKISARTSKNYRRSIMVKLNIHSVVGLVHYAVRNGIIEMRPAANLLNSRLAID